MDVVPENLGLNSNGIGPLLLSLNCILKLPVQSINFAILEIKADIFLFFTVSVNQEVPFKIFLFNIIGPIILFCFVLKKLQVNSVPKSFLMDPICS